MAPEASGVGQGIVVTFGEVMGRVAPDFALRFSQALPGRVEFTFGGGEANVAASVVGLGGRARLVSALPDGPIGDACVAWLRGLGVETCSIVRTAAGRLGLYYLEHGANQRSSVVTYDRSGSAVALAGPDAYDWAAALGDAGWFHVSGITPAISEPSAHATLAAVREARRRGIPVSCDLNFRSKLWRWRPGAAPRDLAREVMTALLADVDVVIGNEEDAHSVLGISAPGADVERGRIDSSGYAYVAREVVGQFPGVRRVAITLRESLSATHNNWGAMLYSSDHDRAVFSPVNEVGDYAPYEIRSIVDRVGAGDAFAAALIARLLDDPTPGDEEIIAFAAAASCLKHSISGDINRVTRSEVDALMRGSRSGRVLR